METQDVFVQSTQEINANVAEVEKGLLPAKMAVINENATLVSNYLRQRCRRSDGLVDASAANIRRAISALVNAILWSVPPKPAAPPKKQPEVQGLTRLKSHSAILAEQNAEVEKVTRARATSEAQQEQHTRVMETLSLCEELLTSNRTVRRTHSRTARLRESLREKFNAGRTLNMTVPQAEALFESLKKAADAFPD